MKNFNAMTLPKTLDEVKEIGIEKKEEIKLNFLNILKEIWKNEVLPIFQKILNFFKKIFNSYIYPFFYKIWINIKNIFTKEFKEKEATIQEEFQKEKKEIKGEIKTNLPEVNKSSLWQRFKKLIK